eukprot:11194470-Lingulodinium_polyedra.AAC.1
MPPQCPRWSTSMCLFEPVLLRAARGRPPDPVCCSSRQARMSSRTQASGRSPLSEDTPGTPSPGSTVTFGAA